MLQAVFKHVSILYKLKSADWQSLLLVAICPSSIAELLYRGDTVIQFLFFKELHRLSHDMELFDKHICRQIIEIPSRVSVS